MAQWRYWLTKYTNKKCHAHSDICMHSMYGHIIQQPSIYISSSGMPIGTKFYCLNFTGTDLVCRTNGNCICNIELEPMWCLPCCVVLAQTANCETSSMNLLITDYRLAAYTRQLCCYNSATKLEATNRTECHRTEISVARNHICCAQHGCLFGATLLPRNIKGVPHCRLLHATKFLRHTG